MSEVETPWYTPCTGESTARTLKTTKITRARAHRPSPGQIGVRPGSGQRTLARVIALHNSRCRALTQCLAGPQWPLRSRANGLYPTSGCPSAQTPLLAAVQPCEGVTGPTDKHCSPEVPWLPQAAGTVPDREVQPTAFGGFRAPALPLRTCSDHHVLFSFAGVRRPRALA